MTSPALLHRAFGAKARAHEAAAGERKPRLRLALLVTAMSICAFALWTAIPAGVLWALPRLTSRGVPVPVTLLAVFAAMIGAGVVLRYLHGVYCELNPDDPSCGTRDAWTRPLSNKEEGRAPVRAIEWIMTVTCLAALASLAAWFFFFAECTGAGCMGP